MSSNGMSCGDTFGLAQIHQLESAFRLKSPTCGDRAVIRVAADVFADRRKVSTECAQPRESPTGSSAWVEAEDLYGG